MFAARHVLPVLPLVSAILLLAGPSYAAGAGWITIRNDTPHVIVVQEVIVHDGHVKRLKAIRLLPGESVRQCEPMSGAKRFDVYDGRQPGSALCSGDLHLTEENQTFSVNVVSEK